MPTQSEALRLRLEAIRAMREAGYAQEDVQELVTARPSSTSRAMASSLTPLATASTAD